MMDESRRRRETLFVTQMVGLTQHYIQSFPITVACTMSLLPAQPAPPHSFVSKAETGGEFSLPTAAEWSAI
jgi:hypothetical protein